jgi:hypothetical protein
VQRMYVSDQQFLGRATIPKKISKLETAVIFVQLCAAT